ncbi:MAG: zinc ABC transporter substrate-binding protein [Candidatus Sericytochromatia bacterium]
MKKILLSLSILFISSPAYADNLNIVTAYPYIEDITKKIGQDKVNVSSLSKGEWDPHFIVPKPSLIAKSRRADLLIINGAQLEIGWLPQIIRQANNPEIQAGSKGFLDLSSYINLIQVPSNISRAQGDVHPLGNPHFILDPDNVLIVSKVINEKLCQLDNSNCSYYSKNNQEFTKKWKEKLRVWDSKMKDFRNRKVIEYHRVFDYFLNKYGLKVENTLEPLPGIPPTPKHLATVIDTVRKESIKINLRAVYNPIEPSKLLADKTGSNLVTLPHDVNSDKNVDDIFSLFDEITKRLND